MQEINDKEFLIESLSEFINFIKRLDKLSFENKIDVSSFEEPIKVKYKETNFIFKYIEKDEIVEILKHVDSELNENQINEIIGFLKFGAEYSFESLVNSLISKNDGVRNTSLYKDETIFSLLEKELFRDFLNNEGYSFFVKEYFGNCTSIILNNVTRSVKFENFATIVNYCLSKNYKDFSELKNISAEDILFADKLFKIKNNHSGDELDISGYVCSSTKKKSNNICRMANAPDSFIMDRDNKVFFMSNVSSSKDLSYQGESWFKYFVGLKNMINENSNYSDWEINTSFIFETPFNLQEDIEKSVRVKRKNIGIGSNVVNFLNNSNIGQKEREALAHFNFFSIVGSCSNLDSMTLLMSHKPIMIGGSSTDLIANSIIINDYLKNSKFNEARNFTKNIILNNLKITIDTLAKIYGNEINLYKKTNNKKNRNIYFNIYLNTTFKNINHVIKNLSRLNLSYSDVKDLNESINEYNQILSDVGFKDKFFDKIESKVTDDIKKLNIKRKNFEELYDNHKNEFNVNFILEEIKKIDKDIKESEEEEFNRVNNRNNILDKLFDKKIKKTSEEFIIENVDDFIDYNDGGHIKENMGDVIDYAIKSIVDIYDLKINLKAGYKDTSKIFNEFFDLGKKQFGPAYIIDALILFKERYKNGEKFVYKDVSFLDVFRFEEKMSSSYYTGVNNKFIHVINRLEKRGYGEVANILKTIKPLFTSLVEYGNHYGPRDTVLKKVKLNLDKYMDTLNSNEVFRNNVRNSSLK